MAGTASRVEECMAEGTELEARLRAALGEKYVVQRELSNGGMATVFLVRDNAHDREVALKVLRPEVAKELGSHRFRHEIAVASRLAHPNILAIHDHGEAGGDLLWYTMPYVAGETLRQRMTRESQLPLGDAAHHARGRERARLRAHRRLYASRCEARQHHGHGDARHAAQQARTSVAGFVAPRLASTASSPALSAAIRSLTDPLGNSGRPDSQR
jgi:Protein kinase domain